MEINKFTGAEITGFEPLMRRKSDGGPAGGSWVAGAGALPLVRRKLLFGLTPERERRLKEAFPVIRERVDDIVDRFYQHQLTVEEIACKINEPQLLGRLRKAMREFILSLFQGPWDMAYAENRKQIGLVYHRQDIHSDLYLSSIKILRNLLVEALKPHIEKGSLALDTPEALDAALYFDFSLVLNIYFQSLVGQAEQAREEAQRYAREMAVLSRTDGLTGLYNLRAFQEMLEHDLGLARRHKTPLSLVYFDVDKFKQINDTQGHPAGDEVLKTIGAILKSFVRTTDTPCRYAGDEFCIILNQCFGTFAEVVCKRLIEEFHKRVEGVTLSIGVAQTGPETFLSPRELVRQADRMMYKAKKQDGFHIVLG